MQRALIQYRNPKNYDLVYEALQKAGRMDLVGFGPKCLIRPKNKSKNINDNKTKAKFKPKDFKNNKKNKKI